MAVDSTLIQAANRALTSTQASAALASYTAVAKARLDKDDPGLAAALYDWCHALMICHLYAAGDPKTGLKSFTEGDISGSREPGETIWLIEYRQIIEDFQPQEASEMEEVQRCDAVMGDFKLDQVDGPTFYTED